VTTLAIVIVSYNAAADLARCLDSLLDTPPDTPHEIVLVDNASTDGSLDSVHGRAGVRVLALGENGGFARANNVGIRATSSELILLLNSDTIVPAGAIDGLVAALRQDPRAVAAGPRLIDAEGRPELSFGAMVGPLAEWRQKRLLVAAARGEAWAVDEIDRRTRVPAWPDWVTGACLLVRRDAAEAAGLLDERYFMYLEDVDFCAALRARGGRIHFTPTVTVTHLRGRSREAAPAATTRAYRASQRAFYAKHHPLWLPVLQAYLALTARWRD
jgi:GT2 family glycosyltransferase